MECISTIIRVPQCAMTMMIHSSERLSVILSSLLFLPALIAEADVGSLFRTVSIYSTLPLDPVATALLHNYAAFTTNPCRDKSLHSGAGAVRQGKKGPMI